jgi:hypothetical protein
MILDLPMVYSVSERPKNPWALRGGHTDWLTLARW